MKKKPFILLILLCAFARLPAQVSQAVNPALNQFEGVWKWTDDKDTIIIILQKQMVEYTKYFGMEKLIGWHRYVKNGNPEESSLQYAGESCSQRSSSQEIRHTLTGDAPKPDSLIFYFFDLTLRRYLQLQCRLLPGRTGQLDCRLSNLPGAGNLHTLPAGFILTRQYVITKRRPGSPQDKMHD